MLNNLLPQSYKVLIFLSKWRLFFRKQKECTNFEALYIKTAQIEPYNHEMLII